MEFFNKTKTIINLGANLIKTQVDEIKKFFYLGFDVNSVDEFYISVLHNACGEGDLDIVKMLCEKGADVNKNCYGYYPIDFAAKFGYLDIVKYLIKNYPVKLNNVLCEASIEGNIDVLDYLLTLNLELNNSNNKNPLIKACMHGQIDAVDRLLYAGANTNIVDTNGFTAIMEATIKNRLDIVKRLVMFGANYHDYGDNLLFTSCYFSHDEIFEFLIDIGCSPDCDHKTTLLMYATAECENNNLKIIKLLLERGADPNFINNDGKKAIDYCMSDELKDLFIKN